MPRPTTDRLDALEEGLQACKTLLTDLRRQMSRLGTTKIMNAETVEIIESMKGGQVQLVDFNPQTEPREHVRNGPQLEAFNYNVGSIPADARCYIIDRPWSGARYEILYFWNLRVCEFRLKNALAFTDRDGKGEILFGNIGAPGTPDEAGEIDLINPTTHTVGTYRYSGAVNDCGTAIGPVGVNPATFLIIDMECLHA